MKLTKIDFDKNGFRNLRNLAISIAPRITIISGHNGIGKSTILGLIANGSELKSNKTLLGKNFRADFSEIFFLDFSQDLEDRKYGASKATLTYTFDGYEVKKECEVTGSHKEIINKKQLKPFIKEVDRDSLTEKQQQYLEEKKAEQPDEDFVYIHRMRIIPRTNKKPPPCPDEILKQYNIGDAAKIKIPTIYLGMSRVSPIGEFDPTQIAIKSKNVNDDIYNYINDFFNSVIRLKPTEDKKIHAHTFGKSNKQSLVPNFEYSSLNISLGQDSLSSIVTAFASFRQLKSELEADYKGGILIIDEIEAGLHPNAQRKLMQKICTEARNLNLQVIATSHSLTIMEYILNKNTKIPLEKQMDSLVYLMDTNAPRLMHDVTYTKIKYDLFLTPYSGNNSEESIKVYFEDDEAKYFFEKILIHKKINDTKNHFGKRIEPISLKVGCEVLIKLADADSYFQNAVLIADNDVGSRGSNRKIIEKYDNFCILPASIDITDNSSPKERTPEALLYDFLEKKCTAPAENLEFWEAMGNYHSDWFLENILTISSQDKLKRDVMKNWFNYHKDFFDDTFIVDKWCYYNTEKVEEFMSELNKAIDTANKNLMLAKEARAW